MAVAIPGLYAGTTFAAVDRKGRLAVPASLRNAVPAGPDGERQLTVTKHATLDCLIAFGSDRLGRQMAEIERDEELANARGQDFDREARARAIFATAETYALDGSGRFILSPMLRMLGRIEDQVILTGAGPQIEIWAPQALIDSPIANDALKMVARTLLEQAK